MRSNSMSLKSSRKTYRISCGSCRVARSKLLIANSCSIPRGSAVRSIAPDWRARVLLVLTHPTIAYGLLLIGIYGLLLEGYNPGAVLPGVVGALSLLLGLYGLQLLAVNYAGLALMALGIGLIITEFFMPAFGSLGVGGLAAFVVGSIILFDNNASGLQMALPLIGGHRRGRRADRHHHRLAGGARAPPALERRGGDDGRRDRRSGQ